MWDAKASSFALGQVIRMTCHGKDYKQPVSSTDNTSSEVEVTLKLYMPSGPHYMSSHKTKTFKTCDIIACVDFCVTDITGRLKLSEEQETHLQGLVAQKPSPRKP